MTHHQYQRVCSFVFVCVALSSLHPSSERTWSEWLVKVWSVTHTLPHRTVPVFLVEACLFESRSEAPSVKNYLTVLHFQCCGLSVSTPCVEQSLSVRGVDCKFVLQQGTESNWLKKLCFWLIAQLFREQILSKLHSKKEKKGLEYQDHSFKRHFNELISPKFSL